MSEILILENNISDNSKTKTEYTCELCNFKTTRHFDLERHHKSKLQERNGKAKTTKCDECDYNASTHWLVKNTK